MANPTPREWTLTKVAQSCTCSVASASSQTIKPGGQETFRFDYHAPSQFANERRWVTVTFLDPAERVVKLVVTARVRPSMCPRPDALNFGPIALGAIANQTLDVGNFGPADWSLVDAVNPPEWLTIHEVAKGPRPWKEATPRETWTFEARVNTAGLKPGAYREELRLRSHSGETATLPVEFVAGIPVTARPSLFMLGQAEAGKPVEATTTLRFFGGAAPCPPDRITVGATGAKVVAKTVERIQDDLWKLSVVLEPQGNPGDFVSGELTVAFPGGNPSDVAIPIHAQIRPRP